MLNTFPQILNLDQRPALIKLSGDDKSYLNIEGVYNKTFSYGKHSFYISYDDHPGSKYRLKEFSQILFEVKDVYGTVIYSGNTEHVHINGSSIAFFYIKEDPLRTDYGIANGPATLTVMGELEGVPQEWQNTYNLKLTVPFEIRKNYPNESDIVFRQNPTMQVGNYEDTTQPDANFGNIAVDMPDTYNVISIDNMDTYGGEVKFIDVHYRLSSSISSSRDYQPLGVFDVDYDTELLTANILKHLGPRKIGFFDDYGPKDVADISSNWVTSSGPGGNTGISVTDDALLVPGGITLWSQKNLFKIFRKTITTEKFTLRLNMSGSGRFGIYSSPDPKALNDNLDAINTANPMTKFSSSVSQSFKHTIKSITDQFGEFADKWPTIDGVGQYELSGSDQHWDEFTFSIPSGSYVAVWLASAYVSPWSASYGNVSVKHNSLSGVNPPSFYLKSKIPFHGRTPYEVYDYKINFLNHEKIPALNVTTDVFPIDDYHSTGSNVVTASEWALSRRAVYGPAMHVENYGILPHDPAYNFNRQIGIQAAAGPSGGDAHQGSILGTNAIVGQLNVPYGADSHSAHIQTALHTMIVPQASNADGDKFRTGHTYTGSVWTAYFGGGDVSVQKALAVGSFGNFEHPSGSLHVKGDTYVEGDIIANRYVTSESIVNTSSGSTAFGNSVDDRHYFTGSLRIKGLPASEQYYHEAIKIDQGNINFSTFSQWITFDTPDADLYAKTYLGADQNNRLWMSGKEGVHLRAESGKYITLDNNVSIGNLNVTHSFNKQSLTIYGLGASWDTQSRGTAISASANFLLQGKGRVRIDGNVGAWGDGGYGNLATLALSGTTNPEDSLDPSIVLRNDHTSGCPVIIFTSGSAPLSASSTNVLNKHSTYFMRSHYNDTFIFRNYTGSFAFNVSKSGGGSLTALRVGAPRTSSATNVASVYSEFGFRGNPYTYVRTSARSTILKAGFEYNFVSMSSHAQDSFSQSLIWNPTNKQHTCSAAGIYEFNVSSYYVPNYLYSQYRIKIYKNNTLMYSSSKVQNYNATQMQGGSIWPLYGGALYVTSASVGDAFSINIKQELYDGYLDGDSSFTIKMIS